MTKKLTPADKRHAAMHALMRIWMTPEGKLYKRTTVKKVLLGIDELYALGRTQRWHEALDKWKEMITDGPGDLHWAILQGNVYAVHAAI